MGDTFSAAETFGFMAIVMVPTVIGTFISYLLYRWYKKLKRWMPSLMIIIQTLFTVFAIWDHSSRLGDFGGQDFVYLIAVPVGWLFAWLTFKHRNVFTN